MPLTAKQKAQRWRERSNAALRSARLLFGSGNWHDAVSRSYYAAYQAATCVCIVHGDENQFAHGWNNPTHDQLPDLMQANGDWEISVRRQICNHLIHLRAMRENADYRPGYTINYPIALECFQRAVSVLTSLEVLELSHE